jgi:outer membrane lipoprotein carrier protein
MQASFTQVIYDNRGKAVETSKGNMWMVRPGKFRWQVIKPIPQLIIANQNKLWIYDPDLEQVTIRKLEKVTGDTPALLLSHVDTELDKNYTVKTAPDEAKLQWFVLLPKNQDSMFEQIKLGFSDKQIQQMQLKDHLGHDTRITFSAIRDNGDLAASLFTFKAPKNTDVIDETRKK